MFRKWLKIHIWKTFNDIFPLSLLTKKYLRGVQILLNFLTTVMRSKHVLLEIAWLEKSNIWLGKMFKE